MHNSDSLPPLNSRQRKFAELVVRGDMPAHRCYADCYGATNERTARASSARLLTVPQVANHIKTLQAKSDTEAVLSLEAKRRFLAEIVTTPIDEVTPSSVLCQSYAEDPKTGRITTKMLDKLRALDMDNRLAGHYDDSLTLEAGNGAMIAFIRCMRENGTTELSDGRLRLGRSG